MKLQSRRWFFAYVAVALLFVTVAVYQLDNNKLYHAIQEQLKQEGINLQASQIHLSMMYLGSIRLDHVNIQTDTFHAYAQRLFIDLDLAALLTGTALPQALYLQRADIHVKKSTEHRWLDLIETEHFKLQRIDISQSKIHFPYLNLDLHKVSLDIRDIGKNKNPRVELRAHMGEGRLDAHGYLRLKRGEITRGFGRLQVYDAPLSWIQHNTHLETFNATITTHTNQDQSWQSFGHITLQSQQQDRLELRGKLSGNTQQHFNIENMILDIKGAGSVIATGHCNDIHDCQISLNSSSLELAPVLALLNTKADKPIPFQHSTIDDLHIKTTWNRGKMYSSGKLSWQDMTDDTYAPQSPATHLDAGTLTFSGLQRDQHGEWQLQQATITQHDTQPALTLHQASYLGGRWTLPMQFTSTQLWLPLGRLMEHTWGKQHFLDGQGPISGALTLQLINNHISAASFDIDASQAEIQWQEVFKPKQLTLKLQGHAQAQQGHLTLQLAGATSSIQYQHDHWDIQQTLIDFSQLKQSGIRMPKALQAWQGRISGRLRLEGHDAKIDLANLNLVNFGPYPHHFTGHIQHNKGKWATAYLLWRSGGNQAQISTTDDGTHIEANKLNMQGLALLQNIPITLEGQLRIKSLNLPFGTLKNVSASYKTTPEHITLDRVEGHFYKGSFHAKHLSISQSDNTSHLRGDIQLGGVTLKRWRWLQKHLFQTALSGNLYATLNLDVHLDKAQQVTNWKGDGDITVYNGKWLLNNKNLKADQLHLSLRKRDDFMSHFKIQHDQEHGSGQLHIHQNKQVSGEIQWQDRTQHTLSNIWPHISYQQRNDSAHP